MKRLAWLQLIVLVSIMEAHASGTVMKPVKNDSGIVATKAKHKPDALPLSQVFVVGDKVKIRMKNNQVIKGVITSTSGRLLVDGQQLDVNNIKWIKKTKATTTNLVGFGVLTAAGFALLFTTQDYIEDPGTADAYLVGSGLLFTAGAILLTSRTKFRTNRGDLIKFRSSP